MIQNVAPVLLLQHKANEMSFWCLEGLQRLPKVTERQSFD